ncbi:MAG: hypothetical protein ACT4OH_06715 [Methylophilaceae bacterium]
MTNRKFTRHWFVDQLKLNSVAIVSLFTAIFGFSYNTWVNHQNETNQNMRLASFEVLTNLGELQTVVNYAHFSDDKSRGHPIDGWKHVTMVRDLSRLLTPKAAKEGFALYAEWDQDWESLETDEQVEARISAQIAKTRQAVLSTIDELE